MNRKKTGTVCMVLGGALILCALLLLLYNQQIDQRAGAAAEDVLPKLQSSLDIQEPELFGEMPTIEIDGYKYIGFVSVPVLNLQLPVMAEWDYPRLKIAPCREYGNLKNNDLVIAGHNYRKHFGHLADLRLDDIVTFTDVTGNTIYYLVDNVSVVSPKSVEAVKDSQWDLVLYTCTYGGQNRVVVGCNRATEESLRMLWNPQSDHAETK